LTDDDIDNENFADPSEIIGMDEDPRQTYGSDPNYNSSVSKALLIQSEYLKKIQDSIQHAALMPDCKKALDLIACGLFDKVAILAKTKNINIELIDAKLALQEARLGYSPFDVDSPELANIENMILLHSKQFSSRSDNGWERILQNKIQTSAEHTVKNITSQPEKPRGFFRRWT